jgi:DNA replication and repair protein RecF
LARSISGATEGFASKVRANVPLEQIIQKEVQQAFLEKIEQRSFAEQHKVLLLVDHIETKLS